MYSYGVIGNCQTSALIHVSGSMDWLCLPRPDSPPVFGKLLDPKGGSFEIESVDLRHAKQEYLSNTNVLVTTIEDGSGNRFQITDFCPRFHQYGRMYRPASIFRIIECKEGSPRIRVRCRPVQGWRKTPILPARGNSHLRYEIQGELLRLTTNMSLTYLLEENDFTLKEPIYLALTWGTGLEDDVAQVSHRFLTETIHYWNTWVKHCSIPSRYQKETIRSALALKLCCYEDTGAILASLTTSLPEERGANRNWDYRFCWLRDAYFVISALHNLGHFEEMEGFLKFLLNIAENSDQKIQRLAPVFSLDQKLPLPEYQHGNWSGFEMSQPVRSNNQAAEHVQNDVYGEMILTFAPIFFDERFQQLRTKDHESLLCTLTQCCIRNISEPDAGLWEIRSGWQEHSFSNLMCWAGIERMIRIQQRGFAKNFSEDLAQAKRKAEAAIQKSVQDGILRNGPLDSSLDAALTQLPILRYPDRALCQATIDAILGELKFGDETVEKNFFYRYLRADDFGKPRSAFLVCSFWMVQALVRLGRLKEASSMMSAVNSSANDLGLFAEHFSPKEKLQSGNFPQAYSHVGQINAAFDLSPSWSEVL